MTRKRSDEGTEAVFRNLGRRFRQKDDVAKADRHP